MHLGSPIPSLALCAALLGAAGCRGEEITHARLPKQPPETAAAAPADAGMPAPPGGPMVAPAGGPSGAGVPEPPKPTGANALRWTLPKAWTETLSGGIRYATLKPPMPGRIDVSVVVLPGPAGGELANVNRWRGQIGLGPITEAELGSQRKSIRSKAGAVSLFDFESEGQARTRMIAGLLAAADGNTWFLKMVGDSGPVGSARPDFIRILETLRLDAPDR